MAANKLNFTQTRVAALQLPAENKRAAYFDVKVQGLCVIVTSRGTRTFYVRRKINGVSERLYIGRFPEYSVEEARTKAYEMIASVKQGENPADSRRAYRAEMTLGDLFDEYCVRAAAFNKRPDKPKDHFRLYLAHWAARRISSIKTEEVDSLHKKLARERGKVTANVAVKLLHVMFNKAVNEWKIWKGENPAHGIKKFPEHHRDRFLQADELPRFFEALSDEPNTAMRDLFSLALLTGARRSNVMMMRWEDVNLERAEWRIPDTKNNTPQSVPLVPAAVEILQNRKPPDAQEFVFPGRGKGGHVSEVKRAWGRLMGRIELYRLIELVGAADKWSEEQKGAVRTDRYWGKALNALRARAMALGLDTTRARLRDLRVHDLRRTLGSWQAKTGASLVVIGKSLNHKSTQSTAIYARVDLDPVRHAVTTATAAMLRHAHRTDDARASLHQDSLPF